MQADTVLCDNTVGVRTGRLCSKTHMYETFFQCSGCTFNAGLQISGSITSYTQGMDLNLSQGEANGEEERWWQPLSMHCNDLCTNLEGPEQNLWYHQWIGMLAIWPTPTTPMLTMLNSKIVCVHDLSAEYVYYVILTVDVSLPVPWHMYAMNVMLVSLRHRCSVIQPLHTS